MPTLQPLLPRIEHQSLTSEVEHLQGVAVPEMCHLTRGATDGLGQWRKSPTSSGVFIDTASAFADARGHSTRHKLLRQPNYKREDHDDERDGACPIPRADYLDRILSAILLGWRRACYLVGASSIPAIPLPALGLGFGVLPSILRERAALVIGLLEVPLLVTPHVAFVGAGVDEFAFR